MKSPSKFPLVAIMCTRGTGHLFKKIIVKSKSIFDTPDQYKKETFFTSVNRILIRNGFKSALFGLVT